MSTILEYGLKAHLEGDISECVNGWDGAGRDAIEVGQHKVPEVLQLQQEGGCMWSGDDLHSGKSYL